MILPKFDTASILYDIPKELLVDLDVDIARSGCPRDVLYQAHLFLDFLLPKTVPCFTVQLQWHLQLIHYYYLVANVATSCCCCYSEQSYHFVIRTVPGRAKTRG